MHSGRAGVCQGKENSFLITGETAECMDMDGGHYRNGGERVMKFSVKTGASLSREENLCAPTSVVLHVVTMRGCMASNNPH